MGSRSGIDAKSAIAYMRNMNIFFEGMEGSLFDKAAKKGLSIWGRSKRDRCIPVYSERIIEYPLLFQQLPQASRRILDFGCVETLLPIQLCSLGHIVSGLDF